jgi:hypothetical protein
LDETSRFFTWRESLKSLAVSNLISIAVILVVGLGLGLNLNGLTSAQGGKVAHPVR